MIKINKITDESFCVIGLKNSTRENITLYVTKKELYSLMYEGEQALLKSNIKNGKLL